MSIYLILLVVVVLAAYLAQKTPYASVARLLLGLAFISMVLVAGLRDRSIGTDTNTYVRYFLRAESIDDVIALGLRTGEFGFWVLCWLLRAMSDQYIFFLIAVAIIVVGFYQTAILEQSVNIGISFFVFVASGLYAFFFNGTRQGIACGIYALAVGRMMKGDTVRYVGYVLLAALFHKSALVMLPLYFIFNRPNTLRNYLIMAAIGIVTAVFFENLVGAVSVLYPKYEAYADPREGGGYQYAALHVLFGLFFVFARNSISVHRAEYDRYLNVLIFVVMVSIVSTILGVNPSGFLRFVAFGGISLIFLWPILLENLPDRLTKFVVGYVFVLGYGVLYILMTSRFSDLVPYRLNSSVFP